MNDYTQYAGKPKKVIEAIAKEVFTHNHGKPGDYGYIPWGHTGTCDDESWRRQEQHCISTAKKILTKRYPSGNPMIGILKDKNPWADIDIPDAVFQSAEAKACGFTKRSFLEAGWRRIVEEK